MTEREKPGPCERTGTGPESATKGNRCRDDSITPRLPLRSVVWIYPTCIALDFPRVGRGIPKTLLARAWLREVQEAMR